LQVLPLLALLLRRRRWTESVRVRLTLAAAASYLSLFAMLLWQALRGQALVNPDGTTLAALAAWLLLSAGAAWIASARHAPISGHAIVLS
jgi:hypothetical protein